MIFDTKQYVPLIYRSSRDYEALLKLLDILLTTVKYETDTLINLYIPEDCPEQFLATLAEHIGYKYNYNDSIKENRIVIDNFNRMIRNRGSVIGIKLACALSLNSVGDRQQIEDLAGLEVFFDYDEGRIIILYPTENTKVRNLIDWVRPVGMYCEELPMEEATIKSDLKLSDSVDVAVIPYNKMQFSGVETSEIFNGIVGENDEQLVPQYPIDYTYLGNGGVFLSSSSPTYTETVTTESFTTFPGDTDLTYGLNKILYWEDINNASHIFSAGELHQVVYTSNTTFKAVWKALQQHSFILDLNEQLAPVTDVTLNPMFNDTKWKVFIEHYNNVSNEWEQEDLEYVNANTTSTYTFEDTTGRYRISAGYFDTSNYVNQLNISSFSDIIYNIANVIDWSGLTEIVDDIFATNTVTNLIYNNSYLTEYKFPPNITQITMYSKFLSNCNNLIYVTFPNVNCQFLMQTSTKLLDNAGITEIRTGTFEIPSNIEIVFTDYDPVNYYEYMDVEGFYDYYHLTNCIKLFDNIGIANTLLFNCNINPGLVGNSTNSLLEPPIAISVLGSSNTATNTETVTINGKMELVQLIYTNSPITTLTIGQNCSINRIGYGNTTINNYDISNFAEVININTDENGATTYIPWLTFQHTYTVPISWGGVVREINLGDAINTIGQSSFVGQEYLESFTIPQKISYIPPDSIQRNKALSNLTFNDNVNLEINGCHSLDTLTTVTIPSTCKSIGECFFGCENLKTVIFDGFRQMNYEKAFVKCENLTEIFTTSPNLTVIDNVLYTNNADVLLWVPWGIHKVITDSRTNTIGSHSFSGSLRIQSAEISQHDTNYPYYHEYTEVDLSVNVTTITKNAFNLAKIQNLIVRNININLMELYNANIDNMTGYINSTAHIYAVEHDISFTSLDSLEDNINALIIEDNLGQNMFNGF